jgi:hypothetical protein
MTDTTESSKNGIKTKLALFFAKVMHFWTTSAKPQIVKFLKALLKFYKDRLHPFIALTSSPEKRAIAAGRYLCRLAISYAILSIIGAIVLALITEEGKCVSKSSFSGSCWEYATERPYLDWAIGSLFISLIVASFLYAFGSYVEAKMAKQLETST